MEQMSSIRSDDPPEVCLFIEITFRIVHFIEKYDMNGMSRFCMFASVYVYIVVIDPLKKIRPTIS